MNSLEWRSTLQEVLLPEVRTGVNTYPYHDFEHWGTPPPREGEGIETRDIAPPPLLTLKLVHVQLTC